MFNCAFVRFYEVKRTGSRRRQASLAENRAKRPCGVIVHASPSVSVMRIHRLPISGWMSIDREPPAEHGRPIVLVNDNLERTHHLGSENSLESSRSSPRFHDRASSPERIGHPVCTLSCDGWAYESKSLVHFRLEYGNQELDKKRKRGSVRSARDRPMSR